MKSDVIRSRKRAPAAGDLGPATSIQYVKEFPKTLVAQMFSYADEDISQLGVHGRPARSGMSTDPGCAELVPLPGDPIPQPLQVALNIRAPPLHTSSAQVRRQPPMQLPPRPARNESTTLLQHPPAGLSPTPDRPPDRFGQARAGPRVRRRVRQDRRPGVLAHHDPACAATIELRAGS